MFFPQTMQTLGNNANKDNNWGKSKEKYDGISSKATVSSLSFGQKMLLILESFFPSRKIQPTLYAQILV